MNALVISLNFNPGHFSHLVASYKLLEDRGFKSYLYVDNSFNRMDLNNKFDKINNFKELYKLKSVDVAVFWFPSILNIIEIIRLRLRFKSKIVYIYHEPLDTIRNYYASGFDFKKIFKIWLINIVNVFVVLLSHKVILPSSKAYSLYKKKYELMNKNYIQIPLIFDDESEYLIIESRKNYISYIGTIAADHAFDCYVLFVESCLKNNCFSELSFLIGTKDIIPEEQRKILELYKNTGRIFICEGHSMTNEEINGHYNKSLIVWNAYNRSMQSGVLPKAYMFGAAIIGTYECNSEFIENHITGILLNNNKDVDEIKYAVAEIVENRELFFENCRNKFVNYFYYKNSSARFMTFINN